MADEDQAASTVDTETEELDKSTDTKVADQPDASGDKAAPTGEEDGSDTEDDESGDQGEDEGDKDSAPTKKENQLGFRLRQLSSDNPNLQRLRSHLQPWVEDVADQATAKDRQRDVNDYVRDAGATQDNLVRDNEQVAREIPLFRPGAPEFNQALTQRAYAQFARDMTVYDQNGATDANGNPIIIGTRMRLIDYMREKAEDFGFVSTNRGQGKQPNAKTSNSSGKSKSAKAKMDAAADIAGGSSNAGGKSGNEEEDPFLKGFDNPYGSSHADGGKKPNNAHTFSK